MKHARILVGVLLGTFALATAYALRTEQEQNLLHGNKASSRNPALVSGLTDAGPEPALARTLEFIEQNKLDAALEQTDALLKDYPNFRLAHLVKGDLLLARARPLSRFGEGGGQGSTDKVADLRAEAIARLQGFRTKPPADAVPRYLLQMKPEQKYAVVVDTDKSRLYLYQNNGGTPQFVTDYYISQGKLGAEKVREGDKKTPVGVYHVTANLPRQKLTDFYGSGAFPINYPNEWDKRQGRTGHGIWLHGTPSDTFSRPPLASDGCVVLANTDLDALAKSLQVGLTPVIISNQVEWRSRDDWQNERKELQGAMEEWRQAWESRDMTRYEQFYSKRFETDGQNYSRWIDQKRRVNEAKTWIKVDAKNPSMFLNPGRDEFVVVTFEQDYRSNNLSNQMTKRQYWVKEDGRWKIMHEGAA
jgi:murein L,D-transpeptidase YafK